MDVYLQHLQHTDAMFGRLAHGLQGLERPAWLCGYGDHVGCLPEATGGKAAARVREAIVPRNDCCGPAGQGSARPCRRNTPCGPKPWGRCCGRLQGSRQFFVKMRVDLLTKG